VLLLLRCCVCCLQELPALRLQDLPQLQQLLDAQAQLLGVDVERGGGVEAAAFAWLLQAGSGMDVCPSEAAARLLFDAVCYSSERGVALAACQRLLAWAGEPELSAGE
jgi:hypothetical protein